MSKELNVAALPFLKKWPIQTWWEVLNVGSLGIFVVGFLGAIPFTYNWSTDPLLWRLFSPKAISIGPGNHHTIIIAMYGIVALLSIWKGVAPLLVAMGVYFTLEAHEMEWYFTYYAAKILYHGYFQWWWLQVTLLAIPILAFFMWRFGPSIRFWAFMGVYFVVWFAIQFPITEDFPGFTTFYDSPIVNAIEISSHIWGVIGYFIFLFPVLLLASRKINIKWWNVN